MAAAISKSMARPIRYKKLNYNTVTINDRSDISFYQTVDGSGQQVGKSEQDFWEQLKSWKRSECVIAARCVPFLRQRANGSLIPSHVPHNRRAILIAGGVSRLRQGPRCQHLGHGPGRVHRAAGPRAGQHRL